MQIKSKVSLAFISDSVPGKVIFGGNVTNGLTANAAMFPNLPVPVADLSDANGSLAVNATAAKTGDHTAAALLVNAEKEWDNVFRQTGNYVSAVSNGDEATIRTAGFIPTKNVTTPTQMPDVPNNFAVTLPPKGKGMFEAGADAVLGAATYMYVAATSGAQIDFGNNVMTITVGEVKIYIMADTHKQVHFNNMPSGVPLTVKMLAVNRAGSSATTDGQNVIPQ